MPPKTHPKDVKGNAVKGDYICICRQKGNSTCHAPF